MGKQAEDGSEKISPQLSKQINVSRLESLRFQFSS